MLALRTLARRAPRTALRLPARPSPSFTSQFISQRPQRIAAAFSTSRILRDEHAQQLSAKLTQEIDLESQDAGSSAGSDSNVEAFQAEHPEWDYSGDVAGSQDVYLTKEYEGEKITVYFSIADFNSGVLGEDEMDPALLDEEDMDMQSGGGNTKGAINQGRTAGGNFKQAPEDSIAPADREELAEEEDQPQPYPVAVNVLIQKPGSGSSLKFLLTANEQSFVIEQLIHIPSDFSADPKSLVHTTPPSLYAGPPFHQLDEEMQTILESYLNARGINSDLASVVADWVDVKEQKEYLGWLGRLKEFVD